MSTLPKMPRAALIALLEAKRLRSERTTAFEDAARALVLAGRHELAEKLREVITAETEVDAMMMPLEYLVSKETAPLVLVEMPRGENGE